MQTKKFADRITDIAIICFALSSILISPIFNTWSLSIPVLFLLISSYYLIRYVFGSSNIYQYVGSANYAFFTALLIYQMHGLKEMHFIAFIGSILLISYQDWKLQLPLVLVVVVHHSVLAYMQFLGFEEVYFTDAIYMDLSTFIMHVVLAAIIFFLCGFWSYVFDKNAKSMAMTNAELTQKDKIVGVNIDVANQIANGNLETKIEILEDDKLGKALLTMQNNLKIAKQREEEEKFLNIGFANSADILRSNSQDFDKLSQSILQYIVKYMGANQGALFILNEQEKENVYLELKSCYAYDRKKFIEKRFEIGEGLIGQTFLEKELVYLTEVPENFIQIGSGLGEAKPRSVVLVPLLLNEVVYGVLELAFFHHLEKYKLNFLQKIAENLASTISNVKVNEETKKLLALAQEQSEALRSQEEEMRQNLEEMQATQEEMIRKTEALHFTSVEMQGVLEGINRTMATIEFTKEGIILDANENFLSTMKCSLQDIVGKHHRIFVHSEEQKTENYASFWSTLASGKIFSGEFKRIAFDGSEVWLNAVYTNILDKDGSILKIRKFATNITFQKQKEAEVIALLEQSKMQEEKLQKNLQSLNETQSALLFEQAQTQKRAQFIESVALTSTMLLHEQFNVALEKGFEIIGSTTGVDRVYFFERVDNHNDDQILVSQKIEWVSAFAKPEINNPEMQNLPLAALDELGEYILKNKIFHITRSQVTSNTLSELLDSQHIKSLVIMPIFVHNQFYGFVGFDYCQYEHEVSQDEIQILTTLASNMESSIEKKRYFDDLQNSQQMYQSILDNMGGIVYRCALDEFYTMHYISEAVKDFTGYQASDFIDNRVLTFASLIHQDDLSHVDQTILKSIESKTKYQIQYRLICKDGSILKVNEHGCVQYDTNGTPRWLDGVILKVDAI